MYLDRRGYPKERRIKFTEPRVLDQNLLTKEQPEGVQIVAQSMEDSTDRRAHHTALPEPRVLRSDCC